MSSAEYWKHVFKNVSLEADDLLLLEAFQISYLPGWLPERELAAVLWAHPYIERCLIKKHPPVASYAERVKVQFGPASDEETLWQCGDRVVWTIAEMLVYTKSPGAYDNLPFHDWDFGEVTSIVPLEDKVVIDGGAGTGRVALEAAQTARHVFAVEPVTRLRDFIRAKASEDGLRNVYVTDGLLHTIPLPDDFADVLITSHALGWCLEEELAEFERVVRMGGHVIHCPGTAVGEQETHSRLVSPDWGYGFSAYQEADGWKRKYWKRA